MYFMPEVSIFAFSVWLAIVFVTKYVSLASVFAAFLTPMAAYYRGYPGELVAFATAACAFVIIRHYENIKRLISGSEGKIKQGNMHHFKKDTKK